MNECYRIYRYYCDLSIAQVSRLTGISVKRLNEIEQGASQPDSKELSALAALYNVPVEMLEKPLEEQFRGIVNEPFDRSYFESDAEREGFRDKIISLSEREKQLILMYRCAENRDEVFDKLIDMLSAYTEKAED